MKGGAAPVLEDTQHVTYPNLAQIENGFVQIANYICLTLKQCFLGDVLVVLTEKKWRTYNIHTFTEFLLSLSICPNFQHLLVWALYH